MKNIIAKLQGSGLDPVERLAIFDCLFRIGTEKRPKDMGTELYKVARKFYLQTMKALAKRAKMQQ